MFGGGQTKVDVMSETHAEFHERIARIYRDQESAVRPTRKSIAIDRDGYVIVRGAARRRPVPWSGLIMVVVAFFGLKGVMMSQFGPDYYGQNVFRLSEGTTVERFAAWTMRPDPMSRWVALQIKTLM